MEILYESLKSDSRAVCPRTERSVPNGSFLQSVPVFYSFLFFLPLPQKEPKRSSAAPAFPKLLLRLRYSFLTLSPCGSLRTTEAALRYDSLNFTETLLRRRVAGLCPDYGFTTCNLQLSTCNL